MKTTQTKFTDDELRLIDRAIFGLLQSNKQTLQDIESQPNEVRHNFNLRQFLNNEIRDLTILYSKLNQ